MGSPTKKCRTEGLMKRRHTFGPDEQTTKKRRVTVIDSTYDSPNKVESPRKTKNEETPTKTKRIKESTKGGHESIGSPSKESPEIPRRTKYRTSDVSTAYAECSSKFNLGSYTKKNREEKSSKRSHSLGSVLSTRDSSEDLRTMLQKRTDRKSDIFVSSSKNTPKNNGFRRERSNTENIADFRNKQKFRENKDKSSASEKNGTLLRKDSSINPWIADFLSSSVDNSSSSHQSGRRLSGTSFTGQSRKRPLLGSYELLGDSLFVRFAEQILREKAVIGESGKFTNGYCVGGQTIQELTERLNHPSSVLHPNVIVLIGTNDFLKNTSPASKRESLTRLLRVLLTKTEKVIFLTVPPIPRLEREPFYWECWEGYNRWLMTLCNGSTVKVIDIAPLFLSKSRKPDMKAFEEFMGYGKNRREDCIHLNKVGLLRLNDELQKHINSPEKRNVSFEELKQKSPPEPEYSSDSSSGSQEQTGNETDRSEEAIDTFKSTSESTLNNKKYDELSVFGQYVASKLRMIEKKQRREKVKKGILNYLLGKKTDFIFANDVDVKK